MTDDEIEKAAIKFSNRGNNNKLGRSAPREASNPGCYFGFIAGARLNREKIIELEQRIKRLEESLDYEYRY